jgi:replicative DNA helicase
VKITENVKNIPPASVEAEESILGSILFDMGAVGIAKDLLTPKEFYLLANQIIYRACVELSAKGSPTDLIAVSSYLNDRDLLEKVGGMPYLSRLLNCTVSAANLDRYCKLVRNKYISRDLIRSGHEIVELGYDQTVELEEAIAQSQRKLTDIAKQSLSSGMESNESISWESYDDLDNVNPIYLSGFSGLDKKLIGFEPGTLTLLAGRPSMGKSAIALNLAFKHLITYQDSAVAFFSLEMTKKQLEYRLWSLISTQSFYKHQGIRPLTGDRIRKKRTGLQPFTAQESENVASIAEIASKLKLFINEDRRSTVASIGANLRQLKNQQEKLGLVIVDYLQMMADDSSDNRSYELGAIGRGLYQLSSELDVPIIALSQVNRNVEQKQDKRPGMSDLSQSGVLEMVADNIIFCYRDEYYNDQTHEENILELILRKARHGETGIAKFFFDKVHGKIEDLY